MKSLFIALFMMGTLSGFAQESLKSVAQQADTETITATYIGSQDGEYHFAEGETKMVFQSLDPAITKTMKMDDAKLKGQIFNVTYTSEMEENENGEEVETLTIVKISPALIEPAFVPTIKGALSAPFFYSRWVQSLPVLTIMSKQL